VVIGLEVHVHLRTASKLFSPAPVRYGDPPNHAVHPIDLGLPGVLPVVNRHAVELAVRAALALGCKIHGRSVFARKNYFYPDLPKGYQISQFEEPLATEGWLDVVTDSGSRRIGITRIHMEEDAGKSIHDEKVAGFDGSHVDLNRSGVPLIEIVSEPDLRSPEEAGAYLRALREIVRYAGVSDADMEKGQLRCDANLSLRRHGEQRLGTRTECKNLNSFRFVEEALRSEIARQAKLLDTGGRVVQATLHYDSERKRTRVMRIKENADDYRYFPDPDLIPLFLEPIEIERFRAALPELPEARRVRMGEEYGLSEYETGVLSSSRDLADFFEAAARAHGTPKSVARLGGEAFASLIRLVDEGRLTARHARELLPELLREGGEPAEMASQRGFEVVRDTALLEATVVEVLGDHPEVVENHRAGDPKVLNFLMGQVMKRTRGQADPKAVREILSRKLEE
jgi:aspartyl-tRNA(Asn)/glutamyl-tRNA(Gln) amidotransferase subunit B